MVMYSRILLHKVSVWVWGGGGGRYSKRFYTGRLRPEVQLFIVLHTIFDREGTPFIYLLLTNGTLFQILSLELCIAFNC